MGRERVKEERAKGEGGDGRRLSLSRAALICSSPLVSHHHIDDSLQAPELDLLLLGGQQEGGSPDALARLDPAG